eukprot:scaffold9352_cov123-Skeletonema_marinoi.AAC.11
MTPMPKKKLTLTMGDVDGGKSTYLLLFIDILGFGLAELRREVTFNSYILSLQRGWPHRSKNMRCRDKTDSDYILACDYILSSGYYFSRSAFTQLRTTTCSLRVNNSALSASMVILSLAGCLSIATFLVVLIAALRPS